jgi:hypothetical protein
VVVDRAGAWVQVRRQGRDTRQAVTLSAISADSVVVTKGLDEGTVVARRVGRDGR